MHSTNRCARRHFSVINCVFVSTHHVACMNASFANDRYARRYFSVIILVFVSTCHVAFTNTRYVDRKMHLSFACHHTSYLWNATWHVDSNTKYDHRTMPSCASVIGKMHFRITLQLHFSVVMPRIYAYVSCWMYECVKLHMWMRQVAGMNASSRRYDDDCFYYFQK